MRSSKLLSDKIDVFWTRREFIKLTAAAGIAAAGSFAFGRLITKREVKTKVFVASLSA